MDIKNSFTSEQLATRVKNAASVAHMHTKAFTHTSNKARRNSTNSEESTTTSASDAAASFVNFLQSVENVKKQSFRSTVGGSVNDNFLTNSANTICNKSVLTK